MIYRDFVLLFCNGIGNACGVGIVRCNEEAMNAGSHGGKFQSVYVNAIYYISSVVCQSGASCVMVYSKFF